MIEPIDFGVVNDITTNVPSFNDCRSTINVTFIPNRPETWINLKKNIHDILDDPDGYVLCHVDDITKAQDELLKLKDRVKELEGQLKDAKKESDKKLCEVYMETNEALNAGVYRLIAIGKELEDLKKQAEQMEELEKENQALKDRNGELEKKLEEMKKDLDFVENNAKFWHNRAKELEKDRDNWKNRFTSVVADFSDIPELKSAKKKIADLEKELKDLKSKTIAEVRYEWKPGCFTLIYTTCDGSKQSIGMDSSEAIDPTFISCGTIPKCSSCAHYMHNPSRFTHDWCYMPIPKEGGSGYIRKLNKEESEGPACSNFETRKE